MSKHNRIIPCLDVDGGRVVKGKKFKDIQDVADPLELAKKYSEAGADELVFYDITASTENRGLFMKTIAAIADEVDLPFTVGGGIRTVADIQTLFDAGVDKASINSAAIRNPDFIKEAAQAFGGKRIVLSMDVKKNNEQIWSVFERGGQKDTGIDAIQWAIDGENRGAGEVVVNSIDHDGDKSGFELDLIKTIAEAVTIPVVASGGAGKMEHFHTVLTEGKASAALAASVFHYDEINVAALRTYLANQNK